MKESLLGLAPLACKTDKIDARVLAVLSHRDLVPADLAARSAGASRARAYYCARLSRATAPARKQREAVGQRDARRVRRRGGRSMLCGDRSVSRMMSSADRALR